eukprot:CAMPEP_0180382942 /NCGR_PEP_ID=MMETSP0989-20121125/27649_1 /TAXON_ID=697907 /ORGANISM="non described non described, Strain CCMP2293" /LENGTH=235 /DNA_ID=CAMNT_0022383121 /DNA_START=87 /DNA_END=795 /DNA_ORIENTATION=+
MRFSRACSDSASAASASVSSWSASAPWSDACIVRDVASVDDDTAICDFATMLSENVLPSIASAASSDCFVDLSATQQLEQPGHPPLPAPPSPLSRASQHFRPSPPLQLHSRPRPHSRFLLAPPSAKLRGEAARGTAPSFQRPLDAVRAPSRRMLHGVREREGQRERRRMRTREKDTGGGMGFSLLASQLFMFGNDWADSNNEGMMGNKVQGLGSTNSEWSNGISDSAETQLQRNV